jgi:hypothetical protein
VVNSEPSRFTRYLTSTKNITGLTLAVGGPVLALAGVLAPPVGLVLVPVLYGIGAVAAPGRKKANVVAGVDPNDVVQSLRATERRASGRVPAPIETKVVAISATIRETLPRADALGAGSPGRHVLVKCATDYLPSALQAYLDLPRSYADQHVVAEGKTPLMLLSDQLDVLARQVNEIAQAANRPDTDKLVVNGRFLDEKFGSKALDLRERRTK